MYLDCLIMFAKSQAILILLQFFIFYISIILGAYTKVCRTLEENKNKYSTLFCHLFSRISAIEIFHRQSKQTNK